MDTQMQTEQAQAARRRGVAADAPAEAVPMAPLDAPAAPAVPVGTAVLPRPAVPVVPAPQTAAPAHRRPVPPVCRTARRGFPARPRSAPRVRAHVRETLRAWGLDAVADTAELLVTELIGNVICHTRSRSACLVLTSTGDVLICAVSDSSSRMPCPRPADGSDEGGRGLGLVDLLAEGWGCRSDPRGKTVWVRLRTAPGEER